MPKPTVVGIFDSADDAKKVKDELLQSGVAAHRIVVGKIPDPELLEEEERGGTCMVAVVARSHVDKEQIASLMRRNGARGTREARA